VGGGGGVGGGGRKKMKKKVALATTEKKTEAGFRVRIRFPACPISLCSNRAPHPPPPTPNERATNQGQSPHWTVQ